MIEDSADETSTGSSQKRPANSQQSKEGVLASNGAYMPKVVSAPSSAKKAKVESVAVDPTSFFGSSKIKQSEKTQVKAVRSLTVHGAFCSTLILYAFVQIKKPRKTMVIEDEDDDMDFGADDDLLMQVAESTEAILSSSTPVANKGEFEALERTLVVKTFIIHVRKSSGRYQTHCY